MGNKHVTKKCPRCGKLFKLGYNGVRNGADRMCDDCSSVKRDLIGYVWHNWETELQTIPVGAAWDDASAVTTITRAEAFGDNA